MKTSLSKYNHCSIDEMDQLLDHIISFEQDMHKAKSLTNPLISQEYKIFKEYVNYRIQDIQRSSITELHQLTQSKYQG